MLNLVEHLAIRRINDVNGFAGRGRDGPIGNVIDLHANRFASNGLQFKRVIAAGRKKARSNGLLKVIYQLT